MARAAASASAPARGEGRHRAATPRGPRSSAIPPGPHPAIAPMARSPATTIRRSKPQRRDELLDQGSVRPIPRLVRQPRNDAGERFFVVAPLDAEAPAPEARLDHDRWPERRNRPVPVAAGPWVRRPFVRRSRAVRACRGPRAATGAVQHGHPARLEGRGPTSPCRRRPASEHVDPPDRAVSARAARVPRRSERAPNRTSRTGAHERVVGGGRALCDDGDAHGADGDGSERRKQRRLPSRNESPIRPTGLSGETIVVAALGSYEARCRDCHGAGVETVSEALVA